MRRKKSKLYSLAIVGILGIMVLSFLIFTSDFLIPVNKTIANKRVKAQVIYPYINNIIQIQDERMYRLSLIKANSEIDKQNKQATGEKDLKENEWLGKRQVALTFDDGPHGKNTLKILELLDEYNAKASFFMLGDRVRSYPDIVKEISEKGHELGNHTWNHKDLTALSEEEVHKEIEKTSEAIQRATGQEPRVFRPPYGAINNEVCASVNLSPVLWTLDTKDWKTRNPKKIISEVKKNVKDGSIILMHDVHSPTVEAVDLLLQYLQAEGYECVTVSELKAR